MAYTLSTTNGFVTSAAIVAQLNPAIPLHAAHIAAVATLEENGCRYSNEDFDVLASAFRAINRTEPHAHEMAWVAAMTAHDKAAA